MALARAARYARPNDARCPAGWRINEIEPRSCLGYASLSYGNAYAMDYRMHTAPIPDPLADPTRDPEGEPVVPHTPGHHNDEPQRPEGPPDRNPSSR